MKTLKFLYEAAKRPRSQLDIKTGVFTFGRFNPPHMGHAKLINQVKQYAKMGDYYIFPSKTHDKKKNPLDFNTKMQFLNECFPDTNFIVEESIRTPFEAFEWLVEHGYSDLTFIVGADRVDEFERRLTPFAQQHIENFKIVSAGYRDPDATDAAGMSSTKARDAAIHEDIGMFRAATGWTGAFARRLMYAVKKGLGV